MGSDRPARCRPARSAAGRPGPLPVGSAGWSVGSARGEAYWLHAGDEGGQGLVDVGADVPVAGVVEGVDAAFGVDGEQGAGVGFGAEGADLGAEGEAEVAEGAGHVEAVQGVEVEGGGGDLAAGAGGGDAQAAEFGPGFDGGGEDGVAVAGG